MRHLFLFLTLLFLPALAGATGEIKATDLTGKTEYAVVINANSQVWTGLTGNTNTFAATTSANVTANTVPLTEASWLGFYTGSFPSVITTPGRYSILIYRQAGGLAAVGDTLIQQGAIDWTGAGLVGAANGTLSASQTFSTSGSVGSVTGATGDAAAIGTISTRVLLALPAVAAGAAGGLVKLDTAGRNSVNLLTYTTQAAGGIVVFNGDGTATSQFPSAFGFPAGMVSTYAGDPWTTLLTAETTAGSFGTLLKTYTAPPALPAFPANFANLIISGGNVGVNLSQPLTGAGFTTISLEKALEAAWTQGAGTWTLNTAGTTLTLYAPDGVTIFRQFNVSATGRQ